MLEAKRVLPAKAQAIGNRGHFIYVWNRYRRTNDDELLRLKGMDGYSATYRFTGYRKPHGIYLLQSYIYRVGDIDAPDAS